MPPGRQAGYKQVKETKRESVCVCVHASVMIMMIHLYIHRIYLCMLCLYLSIHTHCANTHTHTYICLTQVKKVVEPNASPASLAPAPVNTGVTEL